MKPAMTYLREPANPQVGIDAGAYAKAILNILADFSEEKTRLRDTQRALLNILGDAQAERAQVLKNQRALVNILEDAFTEKTRGEATHRALLNILDDSAGEKVRLGAMQRAAMNMLADMNDETAQLREMQRAMLNIMDDMDSETRERKKSEEVVRTLNRDLEERVVQRTVALTEAIKELEGYSYSVSHDLRTPLRAIDGYAHQLLKRYEDKLDDEGKRYLHVMQDNAKKMSQLIDDILAFARMGRLEISMTENSMEDLARAVFEELKPDLAGRALTMEIKPLPPCRGDKAMLHQVWANLLGNAIKFTKYKAPAMVEVGGHTEGKENIYYIKDNGAGYDMQYADKLFGVFQRLHGNEEFEGTGIGLAIVKRIVTRHGGRVWAEGKVDAGATFYFALPLGS